MAPFKLTPLEEANEADVTVRSVYGDEEYLKAMKHMSSMCVRLHEADLSSNRIGVIQEACEDIPGAVGLLMDFLISQSPHCARVIRDLALGNDVIQSYTVEELNERSRFASK